MRRRDFIKKVGGTIVAVPIGATLLACDDDDDTRADAANGADARQGADAAPGTIDAAPADIDAAQLVCTEVVATNHGHTVEVPEADVQAGLEKTYLLTIGVDHTHMLTVSAANMAILDGGGSVTIETTINSSAEFGTHAHNVMVNCA